MKLGYIFLLVLLISSGMVLFGEAGLFSAYRASQENSQLEARIDVLQAENARLLSEIDGIQKNSKKLERAIRGLSLVAPDELLFEFH